MPRRTFRNVTVNRPKEHQDRWPLFNRGVGPRVAPITKGVPVYVHDHFGPGRDAKVVTTTAKDLMEDGNDYKHSPPFTGREARVAEVENVDWPELLNPIDDLPPATVMTTIREKGDLLEIEGLSHDNGPITKITVNDQVADVGFERFRRGRLEDHPQNPGEPQARCLSHG